MMMPSIFRENLFDDLMESFAFPTFPDVDRALYGKNAKKLMKTDVKETQDAVSYTHLTLPTNSLV